MATWNRNPARVASWLAGCSEGRYPSASGAAAKAIRTGRPAAFLKSIDRVFERVFRCLSGRQVAILLHRFERPKAVGLSIEFFLRKSQEKAVVTWQTRLDTENARYGKENLAAQSPSCEFLER